MIRIKYKLSFAMALMTAVVLSGVYFYLYKNYKAQVFAFTKSRLVREIRLVRSILEREPSESLSGNIDETVDQISLDMGVRVTVTDLDGRLWGDSQWDGRDLVEAENHLLRPEILQAKKQGWGEMRRFSTTLQKDMFYVATPFGRPQVAGIVRIGVPLVEMQAVPRHLRSEWLALLGMVFLTITAAGYVLTSFISGRIRQISDVAQGIARGDLGRRVSVSAGDETGELAQAINEVTGQMKVRMEEATANTSRVEAILHSMVEGVMVIDNEGRILLMNDPLKRFLQAVDNPAMRKPLEVVRNIEIQEIADKVLGLEGGIVSREISVLLPEEKIFRVNAVPVVRAGQAEGAVLVFHDITELRRLENVRRDFIANVSHELRTPLTSIQGYAETLLEGALEDKAHAKNFFGIIHSDAQRLTRLVNDLLELSKIESDKWVFHFQPLKISAVAERVMEGLKKQARDKGVALHNRIPANLPAVKADEQGITQVLLNLLDNAVKYNKAGGSVTLDARESDDRIEIEISDTGIGIPPEDCPRIFERFYRVDKARSRHLGGTGLGLSIAKHIVQAHLGEITVQSRLEEGTTFTFTLPKS